MEESGQGKATPLVCLSRLSPKGKLWAKVEYILPTGSTYDRIARPMLEAHAAAHPNKPAVIAGAGSVCLAFAAVAVPSNVQLIAVCPDSMLPEHRILLRQSGAQVILTEGRAGLQGAHARAVAEVEKRQGVLLFGPRVPEIVARFFRESLGAELVDDMGPADRPRFESLFAPVGSGALLLGLSAAFREADRPIKSVGVVADGAAGESTLDGMVTAPELPKVLSFAEVAPVPDRAAYDMRKRVAQTEGLLVGYSTAATLHAALSALDKGRVASAVVVALDAGDRYFSRDKLFAAGAAK